MNALAAVQAPTLPAVRLKRWSWTDQDGDRQITSGDVVTITATVVNYLSDASGLSVGLVGAEPYSFLDLTAAEVEVGFLASGDSIEVQLEIGVAADAPDNQWVRLYTRIEDGVFEDGADQLSFRVNHSLEAVHRGLSAFYTATDGDNWIDNDNWDITRVPSEEELATWAGVGLHEGILVELVFGKNNLRGALPPELGNLQSLLALGLFRNEGLTGPIPPELGNLERLQALGLHHNSLSGSIPSEIGNLEQLQELLLWGNSLSGSIPPEIGNLEQLRALWLHRNSLSGSIPAELENLQQLRTLSLWGNSLSGSMPPELGNLEQLQGLYLSSNSLSGSIPSELRNLNQLRELSLSWNSLSGSIPPEFGDLEQLRRLELIDNSLSGSIPSELGNLEKLQQLYLSVNSLSGSIPSELGNLEKLQQLYLSVNSLSGSIPSELGNLEQLQVVNLSRNSLSGPLPPELGNLEQLQRLNLSGNSLSGSIPPELGNLEKLRQLFLHDNSLAGPIPSELGNLEQLRVLELYGNSLTGSIPPELGKLSRLKRLALDRNALTGRLPRSLMQLDSLETFYFDNPDLCAPANDEFQMWLNSIPDHSGPTCTETALHFASDIPDQSFSLMLPIAPLILPEAQGGISPVNYTLTPTLPAGLAYDSSTRTITGTPTMVTSSPIPFTFKATDATGATDGLVFSIEVSGPVASEHQGLPESFMVHGNYPNPFRESTHLVVDLPWPATLDVEVFDMLGRRVLSPPPVDLTAGWGRSIRLEGAALPSGLYLYRVRANSPVGIQRQTGRFLRVR